MDSEGAGSERRRSWSCSAREAATERPLPIAEVDYAWAFTSIHEGAIYLLQSDPYHVDRLDWDRRKAYVRRVDSEYYTDAISYSKVKLELPTAATRSRTISRSPAVACAR